MRRKHRRVRLLVPLALLPLLLTGCSAALGPVGWYTLGEYFDAPFAPPDDPALDALWDDCEEGDWSACDELVAQSPAESRYAEFGESCGDATSAVDSCIDFIAGLDSLQESCGEGDWTSCDELANQAPEDSEYAPFALTCGERLAPEGDCEPYFSSLDALWDDCEGGDFQACDTLYESAPVNSDYYEFGRTCGNVTDTELYCETLAQWADLAVSCADEDWGACDELAQLANDDTDEGATLQTYGATCGELVQSELLAEAGTNCVEFFGALSSAVDECANGNWQVCDDLYLAAPAGSQEEQFGYTCGNRVEDGYPCTEAGLD